MIKTVFVMSVTLATTVMCLLLISQKGASWRIPDSRVYPTSTEMRAEESTFCGGTHKAGDIILGAKPGEPLITCSSDVGSDTDLYVWGDSHARHLVSGLVSNFPDTNVRILYYTGCMAQDGIGDFSYDHLGKEAMAVGCRDRNREALDYFSNVPPTSIILHQKIGYDGQLSDAWIDATREILAQLESLGHSVVILGGVVHPDVLLADCLMVPPVIPDDKIDRRCTGSPEQMDEVISKNRIIESEFGDNYVDTTRFFCGDDGSCKSVDKGRLLFRDKHHLTVSGSTKLIAFVRGMLLDKLRIQ